MKMMLTCVALLCVLALSASANAQCVNGVCYGPPGIVHQYHVPPLVIFEAGPVAPHPDPAAALCPVPDPRFTHGHPVAWPHLGRDCYRCPPCSAQMGPSYGTRYRRTVGLSLSWNSQRRWN